METAEENLAGAIQKWLDEPIGTDSGFDDLDADVPLLYRNATCVLQIWVEMMGNEAGRLNHAEASKIGRAIGRVQGWFKSPNQLRTRRFGRQRVYFRDGTDPSEADFNEF